MEPGPYLQQLGALTDQERFSEACALAFEASHAHPEHAGIARARAIVLRRAGRLTEAEAYLSDLLEKHPDAAWLHAQMGLAIQHRTTKGIDHFRRAHELEPASLDYRLALVQALNREGSGETLEEAYQLLRPVLSQAGTWPSTSKHVAFSVLQRVCAYDELEALGDPMALGREWAKADHTTLFVLLGHGDTPEARQALMELHETAGRQMEARAERNPI